MTRSKRMQPIQRLAKDKERQAARKLGEAQRQLDLQRERLQQLLNYRDEYNGQLHRSGKGRSLNAFQFRDFNAFVSRIDTAIAQQQEAVTQWENHLRKVREQWQNEWQHAQAIEKAVDRIRGEERHEAERLDQKNTDELARLTTLNRQR